VNPIGLIILGIGIIMFIIGFKGSQHEVVAAFKGVKSGTATTTKKTAPTQVAAT
jgi:hypothetical protein